MKTLLRSAFLLTIFSLLFWNCKNDEIVLIKKNIHEIKEGTEFFKITSLDKLPKIERTINKITVKRNFFFKSD